MEAVWVGFAFLMGFLATRIGMPSLVGYLLAGFLISPTLSIFGVTSEYGNVLAALAHAGVLLLLFSVGLKLNIKQVGRAEVFGTGAFSLAAITFLLTPLLMLTMSIELREAAILSSVLSFSSTVLAVKSLEEKQELRSFYGRATIGILIVQDLMAMVLLSMAGDSTPSWWALPCMAVLLLPQFRKLLHFFLDKSGHDELLLLCGFGLAIGVGGHGFASLGLSGELGALLIGALCARHPKAAELSSSLWGLKEIFLVCFFLSIGMNASPSWHDVSFAFWMIFFLPVQSAIFFGLLLLFKFRARNAFLSALALTNYSEFALIVAAVILPQWSVPLAMAVAFSFVVSAPVNKYGHRLFERWEPFLTKLERGVTHPDQQPMSLQGAQLLIVGMGQIGQSAYRAAQSGRPALSLIGLDSDKEKVQRLCSDGYQVSYANAKDALFWKELDINGLLAVILATEVESASLVCTQQLRQRGFLGTIVTHSRYEEQAQAQIEAGANASYRIQDEAGLSLWASVNARIAPAEDD